MPRAGPPESKGSSVRRALLIGAAVLAAAGLVAANAVARRVFQGELAQPMAVQVVPASLAGSDGLRVLARTQLNRDESFERVGEGFRLTSAYAKKLLVAADDPTLSQLQSLVVTIGASAFRFDRTEFLARWSPEQLATGERVWVAPPDVAASRSRLGTVRSAVINWAGDAAFVRIVAGSSAWTALLTLAAVAAVVIGRKAWRPLRDGGRLQRLLGARGWLLLAVLVPFVAVRSTSAHHEGDVSNFERWGQVWKQDPRSIYVNGPSDYPIIANLVTALPMSHLSRGPVDEAAHAAYRRFLVIFDVAWLGLFAVLLAIHRVRWPFAWTFLIALLPSSWVGSCVWGQIEGVGQLLLCATVLCLVQALRAPPSRSAGWFIGSAVGVGTLLLCKQLLLFAIGPVVALAALVWWRIARQGRAAGALAAAGWVVAWAAATFGWDLWLRLPPHVHSHLAHLWLQEGGVHAKVISLHGFNVWVLLDPGTNAAFQPIGGLIPAVAGPSLFLLFCLFLAVRLWGTSRAIAVDERLDAPDAGWRRVMMHFFFLLAVTQLAMAMLPVGTADRYLYDFYPFAFAALLTARARGHAVSLAALVGLATCAVLYGLFLLSAIADLPDALAFAENKVLIATVHLVLLVLLTRTWFGLLRADAAAYGEASDIALASSRSAPELRSRASS